MRNSYKLYEWMSLIALIGLLNLFFIIFNPIFSSILFTILPFNVVYNPLVMWGIILFLIININVSFKCITNYQKYQKLEFLLYIKMFFYKIKHNFLEYVQISFIYTIICEILLHVYSINSTVLRLLISFVLMYLWAILIRYCYESSLQSYETNFKFIHRIPIYLKNFWNNIVLVIYMVALIYVFITFYSYLMPVFFSTFLYLLSLEFRRKKISL